MVTVTNTKVASVAPLAWRAFAGVSLLYDNPGCAALSGLQPLERLPTAAAGDQRLYDRLAGVAEGLAAAAADAGLALCRLPPATYHVTLCDGVNDSDRARVAADRRDEVAALLDGLPDSLLWPAEVVRLLDDPELRWRVWAEPVSLSLARLGVWGHALVARLGPDGPESRAALDRHAAAREQLSAALDTALGVRVQGWRPHVTLGYFANEADAARARQDLIPAWQEPAREATAGLSATFRSAAVYGFTDMATYWRLGS